jgi:hypothetical protein
METALVTAFVARVNVWLDFPAAMLTVAAGTTEGSLDVICTVSPPVGAAWERVTVPDMEAPPITAVWLKDKITTGYGFTVSTMEAEYSPIFAVMVMWVVTLTGLVAIAKVPVSLLGEITNVDGLTVAIELPELIDATREAVPDGLTRVKWHPVCVTPPVTTGASKVSDGRLTGEVMCRVPSEVTFPTVAVMVVVAG